MDISKGISSLMSMGLWLAVVPVGLAVFYESKLWWGFIRSRKKSFIVTTIAAICKALSFYAIFMNGMLIGALFMLTKADKEGRALIDSCSVIVTFFMLVFYMLSITITESSNRKEPPIVKTVIRAVPVGKAVLVKGALSTGEVEQSSNGSYK